MYFFVLRRVRELAYLPIKVKSFSDLKRLMSPSGAVPYGALESVYRFKLPKRLKSIRSYFRTQGKGFGEDALFSMWWLLLRELRPKKMLEIGVFRGQVLAFWAAWDQENGGRSRIYGLSPFSNAGDKVSTYEDLDYLADVDSTFRALQLPMFTPLTYYSTEAAAREVLRDEFGEFDLVYVDGSHDYDVVLSDIDLSHSLLRKSGVMVLDDAALNISSNLPPYAFGGHPGPSLAASQLMTSQKWRFLAACGHNVIFSRA